MDFSLIDQQLNELADSVFLYSAISCDHISPIDLNISTLTIMFKTTLKNMKSSFQELYNLYDQESYTLNIVDKTKMLNCIIFKQVNKENKRKYAIKVFSNGGLHITGAKSVGEAHKHAINICQIIDSIIKSTEPPTQVIDYNIQMINTNFKIEDTAIDLYKLGEVLAFPFKYDKEQHHALRFKVESATVLVFMSGSVIITGSKCVENVLKAFECIIDIIDKNYDSLKLIGYEPRKRKVASGDDNSISKKRA